MSLIYLSRDQRNQVYMHPSCIHSTHNVSAEKKNNWSSTV